jgi:DUF971 family protein
MIQNILPLSINRCDIFGITINWSDGIMCSIPSKVLRNNCPSAISKAKQGDTSHDKPLTGIKKRLTVIEYSASETYKLEKIWSIGNYAIGIRWGDGHDTGIYPYSLLRELC